MDKDKKEWMESSLDFKLESIYDMLQSLYEVSKLQEKNSSRAPLKKKAKKENWPFDDTLEVFIEKTWKIAEQGINKKLERKGFSARTEVTLAEAYKKAIADEEFMANWNLFIKGDKSSRPTMYFEGFKWSLQFLKFGTSGKFMERFNKGGKNV